MTKKVTLLGATGTIGKNTISLIKQHPDKFSLNTVIANNNVEALADIAEELPIKKAVIADKSKYLELKDLLSGKNIEILAGDDEVNAASAERVDVFISGAVGFCALAPTMYAIKAGNKIGLANKECLVCAGEVMLKAAESSGSKLIPIDSEHNSLFQAFDFERAMDVEKIILTASGGPFRNFSEKELENVTPEMAVKHPNWNMGRKISVDSATLMNKGLEVIEAYYLFPVEKDKIDVLVHPQSVVHGLVQYKDGSLIAGISDADMRIPISYALAYPERLANNSKKLDLATLGTLNFEKPDTNKFRCLQIAIDALNQGQVAQIALNASNEVAVNAFLNGQIKFKQIANTVEDVVSKIALEQKNIVDDLEEIFDIDEKARIFANQLLQGDGFKKVMM